MERSFGKYPTPTSVDGAASACPDTLATAAAELGPKTRRSTPAVAEIVAGAPSGHPPVGGVRPALAVAELMQPLQCGSGGHTDPIARCRVWSPAI
ncbi:MAG: hypothetical protein M1118_02230 [Chloroflexi bacterium]|nr:hypothetical protein [Chloroflexota bacterium]